MDDVLHGLDSFLPEQGLKGARLCRLNANDLPDRKGEMQLPGNSPELGIVATISHAK